ncbi:hypothetical protein VP01_134g15 [Puccinia sorghi]|uniref:Uncharacterized protein n=1 Tax=Puccinia sorghi TaxID=27349 RepID=A0A0L6VNX5_9BASI|nr:hypothetical protein VP01_134g15 [Puccinia sorghi]
MSSEARGKLGIAGALEISTSRLQEPHLVMWKTFKILTFEKDLNDKEFTAQSSNLVFGMFTNGINPYGN